MNAVPQINPEYLQPDAILPEQFATLWHRRVAKPEEALLYALLEQAGRDLRRFRRSRHRSARRLYRDAYNWVSCLDRSHPFSFINVCETLRLSPQAVRERIILEDPEGLAKPAAA